MFTTAQRTYVQICARFLLRFDQSPRARIDGYALVISERSWRQSARPVWLSLGFDGHGLQPGGDALRRRDLDRPRATLATRRASMAHGAV